MDKQDYEDIEAAIEAIETNGYDEGECEKCGEPYCLEPDGHGKCPECGAPIQSLYIKLGLI